MRLPRQPSPALLLCSTSSCLTAIALMSSCCLPANAGVTNSPTLPAYLAPLPASPPADTPKLNPNDIAFARIAATDLAQLKKTLEQAGWPRESVVNLLQSEIARRLNPSFVPQASDLRPFEFWRTGPDAEAMPNVDNPLRLAELERRERQAVETSITLFPPEDEPSTPLLHWEENRRWGQVPPAKRKELERIVTNLESAIQASLDLPENEILKRIWQLRLTARTNIEQLLTPEQLFDYDLRNSATAELMRNELDNFQPTREEFLMIYRLRSPLELQFPDQTDDTDKVLTARRNEAISTVERKIADALGTTRYDEYTISRTRECRLLQIMARRAGNANRAQVRQLAQFAQETRARVATSADPEKLLQPLNEKLRAMLGDDMAQRYLVELDLKP